MATENAKTFTEDEHTAILADRVAKETADLTATVESLTAQVTELQNRLDVTESAKVAAEQSAKAAEEAHEAFKNEVEEREAAAARKDDRLAKAKEVAAHLGDDFFADEARIARIVAMKDEEFTSFVGDLAATAPAGGAVSTEVPRETAMSGASATTQKTGAARGFLLGRFVKDQEN